MSSSVETVMHKGFPVWQAYLLMILRRYTTGPGFELGVASNKIHHTRMDTRATSEVQEGETPVAVGSNGGFKYPNPKD